MFGFFTKKKQPEPIGDIIPGTEIHYYPDFIDQLKSDHGELLILFEEINKAHQKDNIKVTTTKLDQFSSALREHLLLENSKLYIYLRHALENDPDNAAITQAFQQEMREIGKVLNNFMNNYSETQWSESEKELFSEQLAAIGDVLTKRIKTEEAVLYPLYKPPSSYL